MAMLNAPTMECDRVNLRRSVPVQKRQQIFETVPVCTENLVRVDLMRESLNVGHDGRADILHLEPGCLALQAQEPTRSGECCPQAPGDGTAAQGFTDSDRLFFIQLYRWCPSVLKAMIILRPETVVRWHRAGLRRYWRWKSRSRGGRPQIPAELRALISRMSVDNRLWGAPHIHG